MEYPNENFIIGNSVLVIECSTPFVHNFNTFEAVVYLQYGALPLNNTYEKERSTQIRLLPGSYQAEDGTPSGSDL